MSVIFVVIRRKIKMIKLNEIIEQYGDYEVDEEKLKEILIKPT